MVDSCVGCVCDNVVGVFSVRSYGCAKVLGQTTANASDLSDWGAVSGLVSGSQLVYVDHAVEDGCRSGWCAYSFDNCAAVLEGASSDRVATGEIDLEKSALKMSRFETIAPAVFTKLSESLVF